MTTKFVQHTFLVTEGQNEELEDLANRLRCESIPELWEKVIELGKIMSRVQHNGYELVMFDPEFSTITNHKNGAVSIKSKSYSFVGQEILDAVNLMNKVRSTTWGPVIPTEC